MDTTDSGTPQRTAFEPATDVTRERAWAMALAIRTLRELGDALIEGKPRYSTRFGKLDPQFSAVAGRSLQLAADRLNTTAPPRHDGTTTNPALAAPGPNNQRNR